MTQFKPFLLFLLTLLLSCGSPEKQQLNEEIMASMGGEIKADYMALAADFRSQILKDSASNEAFLGLAETQITIYIFGFSSRDETIP